MNVGIILSLIFGYVPMLVFACIIYWLDRFEKEPIKLLVFVFLWGSVIAASVAFVFNTLAGTAILLLSNSQSTANFSVSSIFAPLVEETSKGIVVLIVFILNRKEFDSALDGIVYGAIVGLGFAATENFYYILTMGFHESGIVGIFQMAIIRIVLVGWQHPFYTAFIGLSFSIARYVKLPFLKYFAPLGGFAFSVMSHAFHNTISPYLIQKEGVWGMIHASIFDWIGWSAIGILIIFLIKEEQGRIKKYMENEIALGTITQAQYPFTYKKMDQRRINNIIRSHIPHYYHQSKRFFQLCAELTHKLRQFDLYGEEEGTTEIIMTTRNSIKNISKEIEPFFPPFA